MQRSLDEAGGLGGGGQARSFVPVGGQYRLDRRRRKVRAEFGAGGAVAAPRSFDARVQVVPGE
ncbi:MAG TPA: hypothetical protein VNF47_16345 [Streptosporangiaceae bacterium]|nr:hypothetical protein [Streptosporangiaceae bacterium]